MKVKIHFLDGFIQCFEDVKYRYIEGNYLFLELENKTIFFPILHIRSVEFDD